ncbi:L-rhamnose mutarotase [Marinoscillum furvescens]|uniref:L-rhamnose mutarotase n=1 Tax=Marinoscillum furvescens DSM 4134 TaxID=1122208 RepID=A0A3D9L6R7_MARFU|nr:L-rhamnose mutarotase [Marinoscillum furvescens]REE02005.1 L-rhamnose mutarotase [Marinoscillum furvescens DSM 4134]
MKRYCFALDLKNDPELIAKYIEHHEQVWPEIVDSIRNSGITSMEIYHVATRLFMIMETNESFSFEQKAAADAANETVQKWEELMDNYQERLPFARPNEKWVLMNKIFEL